MIEFKNVGFKYPNFQLQNLNFTIDDAQIVAITGNNASGKTTLIKLMSGLIKNKTGSITIDNIPIKKSKEKIGIIFQNPDNQIIFNTVYDDLVFTLKNYGYTQPKIDENIDYALKMVGMSNYKNSETFSLSTGQKQRIAIANMLAIEPKIIIFDEASVYLDPSTKQALYQLFLTLKYNGTTVIFTTNMLEEIVYADKVMIINDGVLESFLTTSETLKNLDIYRKHDTYIPLKLQLIEKFNIENYQSNEDILNSLTIKE